MAGPEKMSGVATTHNKACKHDAELKGRRKAGYNLLVSGEKERIWMDGWMGKEGPDMSWHVMGRTGTGTGKEVPNERTGPETARTINLLTNILFMWECQCARVVIHSLTYV